MKTRSFQSSKVLSLICPASFLVAFAAICITNMQGQANTSAAGSAPGLDFIVGKWQVEGSSGSQTFSNTEDCKSTPGFPAVVCDFDSNGSFGHSHGMSVHTFDSATNTYSYRSVASVGSSEESTGSMPDAETILWTGKMSVRGHLVPTRLTIRRLSPNEENVTLERGAENGSFVVLMQAKRKRQE